MRDIKTILMITPYHLKQRGNTVTTARLQAGLISRGFNIDLLSLEEADWAQRLQDAIDKSSYDLIHSFHALHFARVYNQVPAITTLPLVLTMTGTDINYDLHGHKQDVVLDTLRIVDKIVVFNETQKETLKKSHPDWGNKIAAIPQGVYLPPSFPVQRSALGLEEDDCVFVLPSGLRPVKNIELACEALNQLHENYPQLRLLIMGAAIDQEYSRQIINRIEALDWALYLGEIPHTQISSYLSLADVVINSSNAEGQPQGALEAMSLSKPCILTAVPGNLNIIRNGVQGFYIENDQEFIQAGQILISDPPLRTKMGQFARELVEKKFTLRSELDAYSKLYWELTLL